MKRIAMVLGLLLVCTLIFTSCSTEKPQDINTVENEEITDNNEKTEVTGEEANEAEKTVGKGILPGFKPHDFVLKDRNDREVSIGDYEGKVVFINFWASWCPPCQAEMPDIQKLYEKYKDSDDVVILTVNHTTSEKSGIKDANKFIDDNGYTFPVLYDVEGDAALKYFLDRGIPRTVVINKAGIISNHIMGQIDYETMEQEIKTALEAK